MRSRGVLVATLLVAAAPSSYALVPHAQRALSADELTALPAAGLPAGVALRRSRGVSYATQNAPAAWGRFTSAAGGTWSASWDPATHVPTRIWGSGILSPGAMASPALAELYARVWLGNHLALLAPGAAASDFVLVSNVDDGNIRAVGFVQQSSGTRVLGGQIGFEFKHDWLFVLGSTALPDVTARTTSVHARLAPAVLQGRAVAAVRSELHLPASAAASALGADIIVPLVADGGVLGYRVTAPITLDAGADGKYLAYVDPASGEPIAARQQNMFDAGATGTLDYNGVDRYPERGRVAQPAPLAHVIVDGAEATSGSDGSVALAGATGQVITAVVGDQVAVHNEGSSGALASATLTLAAGSNVLWDESPVPQNDAQVVAYLAINTVKDFVRTNVDAQMPTLDATITANVNLDQSCNAFFDGTTVNFFQSSTECQNTGLINDVMFHEFGHDLHEHEIIPGVGLFDGAMSEGAADTLAVNITNDSGLGRGFYYTDAPLRELNPPDSEATYPRDLGDIDTTGLIFGGTWWDLRASLLDAFGSDAGEALTLSLYVGALRRSVDIPSSLIETLATDDDDGDLSNGTPHECFIRDAYALHGMHTATGTVAGPSLLDGPFAEDSTVVRVELTGLVDRCHADDIDNVVVQWSGGPKGVGPGAATATQSLPSEFWVQLPLPTDGAMTYSATINFTQGAVLTLPDNIADPAYQIYQANTVKLYCTDFESGDPLTQGWTTGAGSGVSTWAWSVPDGSGATAPPAAFSGTHALVQSPGSDYAASSETWVAMPPIDIRPYSDVRLQYRRWLAVQDNFFDQARITANGKPVWQNATNGNGTSSALNHVDLEWRFQDVAVSGTFTGNELQIGWDLTSDPALELSGWALDDVCLVANPESICGDGIRTYAEQCDDGAANADAPDACRTDCELPRCGDGIVDTGEDCDAGSGDATCTKKCKLIELPDGSGCSTGSGGGGVLVLIVGAMCVGRKRRHASTIAIASSRARLTASPSASWPRARTRLCARRDGNHAASQPK